MINTEIPELPVPLLAALSVLIAVSVTVLTLGLRAVHSTPRVHLPGGLSRNLWRLLCFITIVGPAAFFVLRRRERRLADGPSHAPDPMPRGQSDHHDIVTTLYG